MNEKQSKCCGAPVKLVYGLRDREWVKPYSTFWHECTKCGVPCDVVAAASDGEGGPTTPEEDERR